jgi:hypothetical protein
MSRYEGRFQRTFFKALKELERLQALRAELSDFENGTVSQNPVSPDPEPESQPQASARGSEIPRPKSDIPNPEPAEATKIPPIPTAEVDPGAA